MGKVLNFTQRQPAPPALSRKAEGQAALAMSTPSTPTLPPPSTSPAQMFVDSRKAGRSRTTTASNLTVVGRLLGLADNWQAVPWHSLRYEDVLKLRTKLADLVASGTYTAGVANQKLLALKGVMRQVRAISASTGVAYLSGDTWTLIENIGQIAGRKLRQARRTLTPSEFDKLIAHCASDPTPRGVRDCALFALGKSVGLRAGEYAALDLTDYDRDLRRLRVAQIKTQISEEDVWLPLEGPVIGHLDAWIAIRGNQPGPLLSRLERNGLGLISRLDPGSITKYITKPRGLELGIPGVTSHSLRRGCGTSIVDKVGPAAAQRRLRHSSIETTMKHYYNPTDDTLRDTARVMAGVTSEPEPPVAPPSPIQPVAQSPAPHWTPARLPAAQTPKGRLGKFANPTRVTFAMEASEWQDVKTIAQASGMSAAHWMRAIIVTAVNSTDYSIIRGDDNGR